MVDSPVAASARPWGAGTRVTVSADYDEGGTRLGARNTVIIRAKPEAASFAAEVIANNRYRVVYRVP